MLKIVLTPERWKAYFCNDNLIGQKTGRVHF